MGGTKSKIVASPTHPCLLSHQGVDAKRFQVLPRPNLLGFQGRSLGSHELSDIAIGPIVGAADARNHLPLVVEAAAAQNPGSPQALQTLLEKLTEERQAIRAAMAAHGAILLRGFEVQSAADFEKVCMAAGMDLTTEYKPGIAPRRMVGTYAFTSTEAPGHIPVLPHTEMAYSNLRPKALAFFCAMGPGPEGRGETPLFDCQGIYDSLSSEFQQKLQEKHLLFKRVYPGERTSWDQALPSSSETDRVKTAGGACWQAAFGVTSKDEVEAFCEKVGMKYHWVGEELHTEVVLPQVVTHWSTGKQALQLTTPLLGNVAYDVMAELFPSRFAESSKYWESVRQGKMAPPVRLIFGDGEELTDGNVREMLEACWKNSVIFHWQKGDVLLIDNVRTGHARMDCVPCCPRRINVCMSDMMDFRASF